jgi:hypothetical protein
MADNENGTTEGNTTEAAAAAKKKTEYTDVKMSDGRDVKFAGKRKVQREVVKGENDEPVGVRFDYVNGATQTINFSEIPRATTLELLAHGVSQKVGDEAAGVDKVEDIVLSHADMMDRLKKGEFYAARQPGDSFAGASLVIKAIVEATGKSIDDVKVFLDKKLEQAKAKGEKLSRAELYASFRNPKSKTGQIIERLEKEERSKASKVDADALLDEVGVGA